MSNNNNLTIHTHADITNANSSAISLTQPQGLFSRNVTVNPKTLTIGTAKTLAQVVLGNTNIATNEFLNTLNGLNLLKKPPELAWQLVFNSLFRGIVTLLTENHTVPTNIATNTATLESKITEYLNQNHSIDQTFFSQPNRATVITNFVEVFKEWLTSIGIASTDVNNFVNRYCDYVGLAFCQVWRENPKYAALMPSTTPADANAQNIIKWQLYQQSLQQEAHKPVFNETISLKQLYIPLRASFVHQEKQTEHRYKTKENQNSRTAERHKRHQVVMLHEHIEDWYHQDNKNDAVRLLCGGPGSGKSSSAKMIAAQFAAQGEQVVFLPLHLMRFKNTFEEAIDEHLSEIDELGIKIFAENAMVKKTLIIFDGLDELAMQGQQAAEDANAFMNWLQTRVSKSNAQTLRIKALVTGRDVVMQRQNQFRQTQQILYLLPYVINEYDKYTGDIKYTYTDQRGQWWQNFAKLKGWENQIPYVYTTGKLGEVTTQPLLNYLVALQHTDNTTILALNSNLNVIYQRLINRVYERAWGNKGHSAHKNIETTVEFSFILQLIAVSAWHGNGRTATEKEIIATFKQQDQESLLKKFSEYKQKTTDAKLTQLLTVFYFKKIGADKLGNHTFEFTHKTFEEYLVAKHIMQLLHSLPDMLNNPYLSIEDVLVKWVLLMGGNPLNSYYFDFLINEVELQKTDTKQLCNIQAALVKLLNSVIQHELPMHLCLHLPSYQQQRQSAKHAKVALLSCLGYITFAINANSNSDKKHMAELEFSNSTDFGSLLSDILPQQQNDEDKPLYYEYLAYFNLQNQILIGRNLWEANLKGVNLTRANLIKANLTEVDLSEADLTGANLTQVNLTKANLFEAVLHETNLNNANLSGAYLKKAHLREVNLNEADLNTANLSGISIHKSNLENANLRDAKLKMANLTDVNLSKANLKNADLREMFLSDVNLSKANLKNANLKTITLHNVDLEGAHLNKAQLMRCNPMNVNLTEANLTEANLTEACLIETTLIDANLTGTNLKGADLTGADLTGADLYKADLTGADLTGADLRGALNIKYAINIDLTGAITH